MSVTVNSNTNFRWDGELQIITVISSPLPIFRKGRPEATLVQQHRKKILLRPSWKARPISCPAYVNKETVDPVTPPILTTTETLGCKTKQEGKKGEKSRKNPPGSLKTSSSHNPQCHLLELSCATRSTSLLFHWVSLESSITGNKKHLNWWSSKIKSRDNELYKETIRLHCNKKDPSKVSFLLDDSNTSQGKERRNSKVLPEYKNWCGKLSGN